MERLWKAISILSTCAILIAAAGVYLKTSAPVEAQGEKIGFVDSDAILAAYPAAVKVNEEVASLKTKSEDELHKKITEKFGAGDPDTLPKESKMEIQKMLEQADEEYQKKADDLQKAKWAPVVKDVNDIIKQVAVEEKIDVVLDRAAVIYGGADITEKVIKRLPK